MARLSPKSEAIAYRAYIWARDRDWDCTIAECAEAIGVATRTLGAIMGKKMWLNRFRCDPRREVFKQLRERDRTLVLGGLYNKHYLNTSDLKNLGVEIEQDF